MSGVLPAEMTMNRVIHGAVRRDLGRLDAALARVRPGTSDRQRAADLRRCYAHLHDQLHHHHRTEDELVFPALERLGVDTGLLRAMDSEHEAMAAGLTETATAMRRYAETGSADEAAAARASLERTRAVVDVHLDHEEQELEPLLRPHLESPEWKAVERQLRRQPPGQTGGLLAWLEDGMGRDERSYLTSTVPAPVRLVLGRVFGRSYRREIAPVWRA
jgi:hemerythrin-like domain-containing protein